MVKIIGLEGFSGEVKGYFKYEVDGKPPNSFSIGYRVFYFRELNGTIYYYREVWNVPISPDTDLKLDWSFVIEGK